MGGGVVVGHALEAHGHAARVVRAEGRGAGEVDIAIRHLAAGFRGTGAARSPPDQGARDLAEHPAQGAHGEGEHRDQIGELDQLGRAHRAGSDPLHADAEQGESADRRDRPR